MTKLHTTKPHITKLEPPRAQTDWAYFLDLDGSLIDIAPTPSAVHVDEALLNLVERLHFSCLGAVALVSGRSLVDLEQRMGGMQIPMAGQHGLERRDAHHRLHLYVTDPLVPERREVFDKLDPVLARHPGLILEDKGFSVALHYRNAKHLAGYANRVMRGLVRDLGRGYHLQKGKRVVELKPEGFDKGKTINAFLAERPFQGRRPVFIGDDVSDEAGFLLVNMRAGVSIKVGDGPTCAQYSLPDVKSVRRWLADAAGELPAREFIT
ncbi:MAG: trehalose-phosphatase [Rhodocyclaceae bacterium]